MKSPTRIISVCFAVIGAALTLVAILLVLEGRRLAESPKSVEPNLLWEFVVDGIFEPFIPEPEPGRVVRPAELAKIVSRGITIIAAIGGFFLIGSGLLLGTRNGEGTGASRRSSEEDSPPPA